MLPPPGAGFAIAAVSAPPFDVSKTNTPSLAGASVERDEPLGTKEKFWFRRGGVDRWLFKYRRAGTGEDWEVGVFVDSQADAAQREAIQSIWSGQAGGWMRGMARMIKRVRGMAVADIRFELDGELAHWRVEIPGLIRAGAAALTGPTADPARRVQTINPPGSEVGPSGKVATWGSSTEAYWNAFGFTQDYLAGRSSKHLPFEWSGPD